MADPNEFDHVMPDMDTRAHERAVTEVEENLAARILFSFLIWIMMSFASTIIGFLAILQGIVLLTTGKKPNGRIAGFGTDVGIWFAKSTRYITADSETKPWPWTELD